MCIKKKLDTVDIIFFVLCVITFGSLALSLIFGIASVVTSLGILHDLCVGFNISFWVFVNITGFYSEFHDGYKKEDTVSTNTNVVNS
jgi:hypothetical protein